MHPWLECGKFFRICRNNFRTTGAILPSSRFLARALVKHLEDLRPPARILEVGTGSGSVTVEIARRMHPGDRPNVAPIAEGDRGERGRCEGGNTVPSAPPRTGPSSPVGEGLSNFDSRTPTAAWIGPWSSVGQGTVKF